MAFIEAWVNGNEKYLTVDKHPEHCPHCNHVVHAEVQTVSFYDRGDGQNEPRFSYFESVFKCPHPECERLYIALYEEFSPESYHLVETTPIPSVQKQFENKIREISPSFCRIWNQAATAESANLNEISGLGYRKALEFLVKDYLRQLHPARDDEIKRKGLGLCIKGLIDNPKIKSCAERATWLGNDEAHYTRLWESKDIGDLKSLIELTLHWITMELLTADYERQMEDRTKPSGVTSKSAPSADPKAPQG